MICKQSLKLVRLSVLRQVAPFRPVEHTCLTCFRCNEPLLLVKSKGVHVEICTMGKAPVLSNH